jgi:hypothetical protein
MPRLRASIGTQRKRNKRDLRTPTGGMGAEAARNAASRIWSDLDVLAGSIPPTAFPWIDRAKDS